MDTGGIRPEQERNSAGQILNPTIPCSGSEAHVAWYELWHMYLGHLMCGIHGSILRLGLFSAYSFLYKYAVFLETLRCGSFHENQAHRKSFEQSTRLATEILTLTCVLPSLTGFP